jgi:hypothetical protein
MFIVVGRVIGCLSMCPEVPDRGAMWHETAAQTNDNYRHW